MRIMISHCCMASITFIFSIFLLAIAQPAQAQFSFEEPEVELGEVEVEYHGAHFSGLPRFVPKDGDDDDGPPTLENEVVRQGHEAEISFGATEWLAVGVGAEFEEERGENGRFGSLDLTEVEVFGRAEIVPIEGDGFGASFFVGYESTVADGEDGEQFVFGPILKAARGPVSATANLVAARSFDNAEVEIEDGEIEIERTPDHWNFKYAGQVLVEVNERIDLAVEAYGDVTDIGGDVAGDDPDKHRIGPVVYLNLELGRDNSSGVDDDDLAENGNGGDEDESPELRLGFGVLFGLNNNTADVAVKWSAALEF